MSEENTEEQGESGGIANLRKQYEAQQKELKAAQDALASYQQAENAAKVKELLKAKGIPENAVKFYSGDVSEDAVGKWAEENADLFGGARPPAPQNDANAQAAAVVAAAVGNSTSTQGGAVTLTDGRVIGDPAEIQRLISTQPYAELVKLGLMPDPSRDPYRRPVL